MKTTHRIPTRHGSFIALVMVIAWLDFVEVLLETFILAYFLYKFLICFFKFKHYFGHISGMVGPIDVKRKGSALVEYWVQFVTLTFDLTHDLDLGCFKVKFRNSSISGIVGPISNWENSPRQAGMYNVLIVLKLRVILELWLTSEYFPRWTGIQGVFDIFNSAYRSDSCSIYIDCNTVPL